jgi:hypothetical protein
MNRYLLADIAEMLEMPNAAPMAHRDGGLYSSFDVSGMHVWMHHDDLECSTVRVLVMTIERRELITEATIDDRFNGELVAEFVQAVAVRYADRVEVK